jgi:nucleotide-binding universal stress UspA family protein
MSALSGLSELPVSELQRRIVIGYDGSEHARKALDWAIAAAERDPAVIDVVTAWTFPMVPAFALSHTVADVEKAARRELDDALTHVAEVAPDLVVRGEMTDDAAGPALVAASKGADLLVVGPWGRGAMQTLVLGSVSAYCARHAPCTVVVVR